MTEDFVECIGAIDQGTQSTRFYLFDKSCDPIGGHQIVFSQSFPQAGWCEHDPMEIWRITNECIYKAMEAAKLKYGPIKVLAVGIANQRETTLCWDSRTGCPLYNAIVWLDNRTGDMCSEMEEKYGKEFFRPVTGLPISTYFSAFKMKWMYENIEAVRIAQDEGHACFGTMDSWLLYKLTGGGVDEGAGVYVTDPTNASRTLLMDLKTLKWHKPYLELFGIPESALPEIVSSAQIYGHIAHGQLAGVPISGCLGDQQAAMLGQRCVMGEAKSTYGTGAFMLLNTGETPLLSTHGLITTVAFRLGMDRPPIYALEGSIAVAGWGLSWLRDNLGIIAEAHDSEALAATVHDTAGLYFVPAFAGLMAPHWDNTARGVMLGITGYTKKAHIARAMLEAICFSVREVLDAMRRDSNLDLAALRVDGGCATNNLLMQLQADILQTSVSRPKFQETTAQGAALAAGLGAGVWSEKQVFTTHADLMRHFHPIIPKPAIERRFNNWSRAVQLSRGLDEMMEQHESGTNA